MAKYLAGFLLLGCMNLTPAVPAPNPPPDTDLCGQMCDHLDALKCEESKPVYNNDKSGPPDVPNQTCKDFCEEMQNKGVLVNPRCVEQVTSCEQIETYRQKDPASCGAPSANPSGTP